MSAAEDNRVEAQWWASRARQQTDEEGRAYAWMQVEEHERAAREAEDQA